MNYLAVGENATSVYQQSPKQNFLLSLLSSHYINREFKDTIANFLNLVSLNLCFFIILRIWCHRKFYATIR